MLKFLNLFSRRGPVVQLAAEKLVEELSDVCGKLTHALEQTAADYSALLVEHEELKEELELSRAVGLAAADVIEILLLVDPKTLKPAVRFHVEEDADLANSLADNLYVLHETLRRADQLPHLVEGTLH